MIGETVHYVSYGSPVLPDGSQKFKSLCRAALISELSDDANLVGLVVLNPTGQFFTSLESGGSEYSAVVAPDASLVGGSWHRLHEHE